MTETARAVAWKCQKCNTIVPEPRVRCSACRSWKGGQRKPYTKSRSKAAQKRKEREANETLSILAEEAEEKRASQRRRNKEMSYGGLALSRVRGKPGVTKGGQNVLLMDSRRRYMLKWFPCIGSKTKKDRPAGFGQEGPSEVKYMVDYILPLIDGNP